MFNSKLAIKHECIPIYDRFLYCCFVHVNIELSLVVGWFKVELMRKLRFLWSVLCKEGAWVVITTIMCIARQCVAYWADSAELCYGVLWMCYLWTISLSMCYMTDSWVFRCLWKEGSFRKLVFMISNAFKYLPMLDSLWRCL